MSVLARRRAVTALASALVLATGILTGPAAQAAQSAPAAQCRTTNGFPPKGGTNTGGTPPRYKFSNSPYIGAIYDSCDNVIKLYFGGYSANLTHYIVRMQWDTTDWQDIRMAPGPRRMWTVEAPGRDYNFLVQACNGSACTRFSPQLYVNAR
ncbi:hypothetical protein [Streptomyces antimicrobicus]|uniref:Secreted protein n=1 Tax=Streptomyces antimicrobicus TaxID=2883108 RepID=A0ABS8B6F0_9ACTN|nr:hypothetical protein [Streptomyces antimicrobicus]MCB5180193.1 hypothetical protein [Streptomyces antimicrobicus]